MIEENGHPLCRDGFLFRAKRLSFSLLHGKTRKKLNLLFFLKKKYIYLVFVLFSFISFLVDWIKEGGLKYMVGGDLDNKKEWRKLV